MKAAQMATLRFLSLAFLLPGLGGLVLSAMISTHYLDTMPRYPVPEEGRIIARGIHGIAVYQTEEEDRRLSLIEYGSVGFFAVGLILSFVYLEKWGRVEEGAADEEKDLVKSQS